MVYQIKFLWGLVTFLLDAFCDKVYPVIEFKVGNLNLVNSESGKGAHSPE